MGAAGGEGIAGGYFFSSKPLRPFLFRRAPEARGETDHT